METPKIISKKIRGRQYSATLSVDAFTGIEMLKTTDVGNDGNEKPKPCILVLGDDGAPPLVLYYHAAKQDDNKELALYVNLFDEQVHKGDQVSFLFDDNSILDVYLEADNGALELYKEDFEVILNKHITRIKFGSKNQLGYQYQFSIDIKNIIANAELGKMFNRIPYDYIFQDYTKFFLKISKDFFQWEPNPRPAVGSSLGSPLDSYEDIASFCYVYLMVDENTRLYKIGMANNPEHREKTLQSEKPTISKICEKRLPSRELAAAMEKMLHNAYAQKRVRGEWFNLSPAEIWQIQEVLK